MSKFVTMLASIGVLLASLSAGILHNTSSHTLPSSHVATYLPMPPQLAAALKKMPDGEKYLHGKLLAIKYVRTNAIGNGKPALRCHPGGVDAII